MDVSSDHKMEYIYNVPITGKSDHNEYITCDDMMYSNATNILKS